MQQKLKSTVIRLQNEELLQFVKIISYTKFGYNSLFVVKNQKTLLPVVKHMCVLAFSRSLLQINNLLQHFQQMIQNFKQLNNKILSPILYRIQEKDLFYLICPVEKYSLKDLVMKREGLTQYEVVYFVMEIFQILNYCKSRDTYFEMLTLDSFYLNQDMKLVVPFSMFLNTVHHKPLLKRLPFRTQTRNRNHCPDLFLFTLGQKINIHLVNSWNLGILIYELLENCKPFQVNCSTPLATQNNIWKQNNQSISQKFYQLQFNQTESPQAKQLIRKVLVVNSNRRLNFPLIVIQQLFKKFQQIPHILPTTILTCPPSQQFKSTYKQHLRKQKEAFVESVQKTQLNKQAFPKQVTKSISSKNIAVIFSTNKQISQQGQLAKSKYKDESISVIQQDEKKQAPQINPDFFTAVQYTQQYIKVTQRNLSQNKVYIEEFVDISHVYGYGYQMNTGSLSFVFNDQTEFYYPNASRKTLIYVNDKHNQTSYSHDKLPEQQELKKKFYILQGYSKSIKKFKNQVSNNQKPVKVLRYGRTKHGSIFYLSNDTIQLFFNDKISFLMTKSSIYVLNKNNDKYQKYDIRNQNHQIKTRKDYVVAMAKKVFGWTKDTRLQDEDFLLSQQDINNKDSFLTAQRNQQKSNNQLNNISENRMPSLKRIQQEGQFKRKDKKAGSLDYQPIQ